MAMTIEELREWIPARLKLAEYRCEVCRVLFDDGANKFQLDHDHKTNRPRGVLCGKCNRMEGCIRGDTFSDKIQTLNQMVAWLTLQELEGAAWKPSVRWEGPHKSVRRLMDGRVELLDGLPMSRRNDVPFVVQELPRLQPCSVETFVRGIGFEPKPDGKPSEAWTRMRNAFFNGQRRKVLQQVSDGMWIVRPT
jgi:hypothetical protein